VAVILAGGVGARMGSSVPKQLIEIAGKTILEHSTAAFQNARDIDEIIILMTPGHLGPARDIVESGGYDKVTQVLEGGSTRSESTAIALGALGDAECNVLLHDAARPLVSQRIIGDVIDALATSEAVATVIPMTDTVITVDDERGVMKDVIDRQTLRRHQTPQAFRLSVIAAAYESAWRDPDFVATDDCTVVARYRPGTRIALVAGDERNVKITEPTNVEVAELFLRLRDQGRPR